MHTLDVENFFISNVGCIYYKQMSEASYVFLVTIERGLQGSRACLILNSTRKSQLHLIEILIQKCRMLLTIMIMP